MVGVVTAIETVPDLHVPDHADVQYSSITIYVAPQHNAGLSWETAATVLPYIVAGLTCLLVVLLAAQLLRQRQFGIVSGVALLTVGALSIVSGAAVPAMRTHAAALVVESLGLPTSGDQASTWVVPQNFSVEFSDWPVILLGLLTVLGGWLILRARQLRLDLEGTI
ncbi:hypothetical protein [uncultured Agrococcus sp.]|uniref:hypothetical protein n=1 Tax=uncultured Agrococcus sp. TaxID=382258 RepID=UPI0025F2B53E|nr:hypothetical protein [uncultured Agrococcus sp.]